MRKLLILLLMLTANIFAVNYNPAIGVYGATKGNNLDAGILTQHIVTFNRGALLLNIGGAYIPRISSQQEGEILVGVGFLEEKIKLPFPIKGIKTISLGWSLDITQRFSIGTYNGMTIAPTFSIGLNRVVLGASVGYQYDPLGVYFLDKHSTFARASISIILGKKNYINSIDK